jgi:hypothetical protein
LAQFVNNVYPATVSSFQKQEIIGLTFETVGRHVSNDNLPTNAVQTARLLIMPDNECTERIEELNGVVVQIDPYLFCSSSYPAVLLTSVSTLKYPNF